MGTITFNEDNVQVIEAKNEEEAIRRLNNKYNTDYIIVNKRTVPEAKFFGLFTEDKVQVSYVVKNNDTPRKQLAESVSTPSINQNELNAFLKNKRDFLQKQSFKEDPKMVSQIDDISKSIKELKDQLSLATKAGGVPAADEHPTIKKIKELLADNEFTYNYIEEIAKKIRDTFAISELDDEKKVQRAVIDWIGEWITVAKERVYRKPHVVIIVGPTGVGKTTTLVKMATVFLVTQSKKGKEAKFCFITTDIMRVGAMEQLAKMGELLEKSVVKAQNNDDVKALFNEYKDKVDTIFIDTAGYGPNDVEHIASMKKILSVKGLHSDIYLAVSASTKAKDLHNIMQNYEPFGYQSVIITKCDESQQFGNVLSVLHERRKDISFITYGQKITKTITRANVAEILKKLEGFNVDEKHIDGTFGVLDEDTDYDTKKNNENDSKVSLNNNKKNAENGVVDDRDDD